MKKTTTESESEKATRLARFHAMTDAEIEAGIAGDSDARTPDDPEVWAKGEVVRGDGSVVVPVEIDAETARALRERHIDYRSFIAGLLHGYLDAQKRGEE